MRKQVVVRGSQIARGGRRLARRSRRLARGGRRLARRGRKQVARRCRELALSSISSMHAGFDTGPRVTRYAMYERLSRFRCSECESKKVLSISNSKRLCGVLGFGDNQILDTGYPEYNLLELPFPDHSFDCVVSDQVLEHVEGDPQVAMDEAFRVLKPGGIGVHTTCFINPIHKSRFYGDYWRFTPEALTLLAEKHASIIEAGGWGNPYVWIYVWAGLRYAPIPHSSWHPFHWLATKNARKWPIVTWIVAKKREKQNGGLGFDPLSRTGHS
jgi:SAM-dependent methyltransferase